jgi:hypothetical protein
VAEIACPRCGKTVRDLDLYGRNPLLCPECGQKLKESSAAVHASSVGLVQDSSSAAPAGQHIQAKFDQIDRSIILCCPECRAKYDWITPISVPEVRVAPSCKNCAAPYPLACHDCGHDLSANGFDARVLRDEATPIEQRPWGLFCSACAATYDRFALPERELKQCAQCGMLVAPGDLHVRSINATQMEGAVAYHRTQHLGLCPECADKADRAPRRMLTTMGLLLLLFVGFAIVCWFLS